MHTIRFGDNVRYGVQTLGRTSYLQLDFDKENAEPPKNYEMVLDPAFSFYTAWNDRLGSVGNQ